MSAAKAEPDTIASAVANKTSFFMTIPITLKKISLGPVAPQGARQPAVAQFNVKTIWMVECKPGSKKREHLPTF
jgi:hypothetical protein